VGDVVVRIGFLVIGSEEMRSPRINIRNSLDVGVVQLEDDMESYVDSIRLGTYHYYSQVQHGRLNILYKGR